MFATKANHVARNTPKRSTVIAAGFALGLMSVAKSAMAEPRIIVPVANPVATPTLPTTVRGLAATPGFLDPGRFGPLGWRVTSQGFNQQYGPGVTGYTNYYDPGTSPGNTPDNNQPHTQQWGNQGGGSAGYTGTYTEPDPGWYPGGHLCGIGCGCSFGGQGVFFNDPAGGLLVRVNFGGITPWSLRSGGFYWRTGYNWAPPYRIDQRPTVYIPVSNGWPSTGAADQQFGPTVDVPPPVAEPPPPLEIARMAMQRGEFSQAIEAYRASLSSVGEPGASDAVDDAQQGDVAGDVGDDVLEETAPDLGLVWRELSIALLADGRVSEAVSVLMYTMDEMPSTFEAALDGASLGMTAGRLGALGDRARKWGQSELHAGGLLLAVEAERAAPRPRRGHVVRLLGQATSLGSGSTVLHDVLLPGE